MPGPVIPRRSLRRRAPLLQRRAASIAVPVGAGAVPFRVYESYLDAWQRRDAAAVARLFAPQGEYRSPVSDGPRHGVAVEAAAQDLFDALGDLRFEVTQVDAAADCVVDQWVLSGRWSRAFRAGPLAGKPPTGRAFALQGIGVIEVVDGQLRSATQHWDRQLFLAQVLAAPVRRP